MAAEFNLPGSSFEEVQKILRGYSSAPENSSLDALSKIVGLHTTVISRNNKFLSDVGLIAGGKQKTATDLGKKLGRALDHRQTEDAQNYWREAVQTNEKVSGLITTVRIKGGMSEKDFTSHILYVSGQSNNSGNKTGARAIVDVLVTAKLLVEENGKLVVSSTPAVEPAVEVDLSSRDGAPKKDAQNGNGNGNAGNGGDTGGIKMPPIPATATLTPQIAINIQLHLPETENAEVYEKLFRALRENLLNPKE